MGEWSSSPHEVGDLEPGVVLWSALVPGDFDVEVAVVPKHMVAEAVNLVVGILGVGFSLKGGSVAAEAGREARDVLLVAGDGDAVRDGRKRRKGDHAAVVVVGRDLERTGPTRRN